ncbi:MAG TPA: glycoside hydrolase family 9 protein, partial [Clostridia bacterium]|nr:glycoside hydrolase family 9 protein [Clostridia bacterium]
RQANGPMYRDADGEFQITPLAEGKRLVVAPEVDKQRLLIEAPKSKLALIDGRGKHDNGWFIVRSLIPAGATTNAMEWVVTPHAVPGWTYSPVVQVSQIGYHPQQSKIAVIETDKRDTDIKDIRLVRFTSDGKSQVALSGKPEKWGDWLRYQYLRFDFSKVTEPGVYLVEYGDFKTSPFVISPDAYKRHVWQPTLEAFLPVQMCHMRVNDRYRVWHGLCHDDDALMAPTNYNHFDGYIQGPSTLTKYQPFQYVPNLNAGGWHDAGDYDLRVESQAETIEVVALAYEEFGLNYDETTIDQTNKLVEMHQPDGKPDLVQQVEHGVITIVNGYRSLGRLYRGIICPTLRQYVFLGDGAISTDNRKYDASLKEKESRGECSGLKDDNWVFTEENPQRELYVASSLALAARVLKQHNPELAKESLAVAEELWQRDAKARTDQKIEVAVELFLSTGKDEYKTFLSTNANFIAERMERFGWRVGRALPKLQDQAFEAKMVEAAKNYRKKVDDLQKENPYGVPYRPDIWGAGWGIQRFGFRQYFLCRAFPEAFSNDYMLNALNFILGCHPGSNTASFASGVGANSLTVAYGVNRADWSYIPGGVGSGTALIRPDLPELKTWPFFWQQAEYVMGGGATDFMFLAMAADKLLNEK